MTALAQIVQRGFVDSFLGDTQKLTGQPVLGLCLSSGLDQMASLTFFVKVVKEQLSFVFLNILILKQVNEVLKAENSLFWLNLSIYLPQIIKARCLVCLFWKKLLIRQELFPYCEAIFFFFLTVSAFQLSGIWKTILILWSPELLENWHIGIKGGDSYKYHSLLGAANHGLVLACVGS